MLPVRTDKAIPKEKISKAIEEIKKININKPVRVGDIIVKDFLGLAVNLVTTRECN